LPFIIIVIFTCPKTPKPFPDNLPGFGFWFFERNKVPGEIYNSHKLGTIGGFGLERKNR
jgi:hypothetical protein